jgi:threonine synthase
MRLTGTRPPGPDVTFKQAVLGNLPAGGGLFVPAALPAWPDVEALLQLPWSERCTTILHRLLGDEYTRPEIAEIVAEAFDFPLPLVRVDDGYDRHGRNDHNGSKGRNASDDRNDHGDANDRQGCIHALELFHGPSLAFKDFGVRFLAAILERWQRESENGAPGAPAGVNRPATRMVLTATSGDTGAAVAAAFWRRPGFRVAVLYPHGRISDMQERQLACLGENVLALAVEGTFDDCQRLAKACFADAALAADLGLTSANSINVARLLAQILYFFEALAQVRAQGAADPAGRAPARAGAAGTPVVVAVPSGNFGNLCAGLWARALGLPVAGLVAATNANRTVPDYLDSGSYRARPGLATLSNAMDVGDPSNWERIEWLYRRDWQALRHALRWGSLDDAGTAAALQGLWRRGYAADPHGAVAYGVLRSVLRPGETGIFLATAHPAKFAPALARLGIQPAMPEALGALLGCPLRREVVAADLDRLQARLRAG